MTEREQERAAIVAWLTGAGGNIPALSAFAPLVSGNNQPDMSGDPRNRLPPHRRRAFDDTICDIGAAIARGDHIGKE